MDLLVVRPGMRIAAMHAAPQKHEATSEYRCNRGRRLLLVTPRIQREKAMSDEIEEVEVEARKVESVELSDGALDNVVGGDKATNLVQLMQSISDAMQKISDASRNAIANIR
jgi:hypothetical protein